MAIGRLSATGPWAHPGKLPPASGSRPSPTLQYITFFHRVINGIRKWFRDPINSITVLIKKDG
jgi:hypothetical protein